jgi:hypothetical protein
MSHEDYQEMGRQGGRKTKKDAEEVDEIDGGGDEDSTSE